MRVVAGRRTKHQGVSISLCDFVSLSSSFSLRVSPSVSALDSPVYNICLIYDIGKSLTVAFPTFRMALPVYRNINRAQLAAFLHPIFPGNLGVDRPAA